MMNQPECYLSEVMHSLDENGIVTSERTIKFLKQFMDAYEAWINKFLD